MTPVSQEFRHDPRNDVWGDCHRAALATILDLPLREVPHFFGSQPFRTADEVWHDMEEWLQPRGFTQITVVFPGSLSLDEVTTTVHNLNHLHGGPLVYLLGGESRNNCGHTVVCREDRIAWDPSVDKSGIVSPSPVEFADGTKITGWHVTFIGHAVTRCT